VTQALLAGLNNRENVVKARARLIAIIGTGIPVITDSNAPSSQEKPL
jgi:hypothetical protein